VHANSSVPMSSASARPRPPRTAMRATTTQRWVADSFVPRSAISVPGSFRRRERARPQGPRWLRVARRRHCCFRRRRRVKGQLGSRWEEEGLCGGGRPLLRPRSLELQFTLRLGREAAQAQGHARCVPTVLGLDALFLARCVPTRRSPFPSSDLPPSWRERSNGLSCLLPSPQCENTEEDELGQRVE